MRKIEEAIGPEYDEVKGTISRKEKLRTLLAQKDWSHLSEEQRQAVEELVEKHDDLFIVERGELGLINQEPAHILVENTTPCRAPVYRYPEKAKETIKEILEDLEQRDIIEKSTAAWLSPIVLVNKPSGEKRLCLDYRKVNTHLATDIFPIPKLEELVENVAGHQFYTTLDLKDAYYQVLLDEESRDLTTFTEGVNLYRFRRLPFGLSCSAAIFVRQLNNAIARLLKQTWIKTYLDDVLISAPNYETLLDTLDTVFEHMKKVGIKLNVSKCSIGKTEIKFLGHIISKEGYRPDPENIEPIVTMKAPRNVKETRRFLGMSGFYRKHIRNFAKIAASLTGLTRKNHPFEWDAQCQEAFETLKKKLVQAPVLAKADIRRPFILETDASQTHVAAVLMQYEEGVPRVIAYFSKKLRPVETRYSTTDREALAIILACRQFHHFLWGTKCIIRTNHQPLVSIFKQRTKCPRMNRWVHEMREYRYTIQYKAGKRSVVADHLSRPVKCVRVGEERQWLGKTNEEIIQLQREEPRWREMIEYLQGGRIPRNKYPRTTLGQFTLEEEVLYLSKQKADGTIMYLLAVPRDLRKAALQHAHDREAGHMGQHKTILKAEHYFYWPNLKQDAREYVKACVTCQQFKTEKNLQHLGKNYPQ